jgi:hypothetical protein
VLVIAEEGKKVKVREVNIPPLFEVPVIVRPPNLNLNRNRYTQGTQD